MRKDEEYREMLAAHALGALEGAEARDLGAHLATCAGCRAELEELRDASAALAFAAPLAEPPALLRSRILESIRAEGARVPARGGVDSRQAASNVVPFEKPARRSWGAYARFGALAASLAFIALAVSLVLLWNRYSSVKQELAREREVRELLSAPGARVMTLSGTEMASGARAKFVYDGRTGHAMLMAYDLPRAPAGKAYQLWFIEEGKPPMPGHVFNTDEAGRAEMRDQMPLEARGATIFAVTLEPSEGVPAPTGPKYLLGTSS